MRLNSQNILQIPVLLHKYEIVLFNISIGTYKYKEILKQFNMSTEYEEKYIDGNVKIPSVDIFMYELNPLSQEYEYMKLFGAGYTISIPKNILNQLKMQHIIKFKLNYHQILKQF